MAAAAADTVAALYVVAGAGAVAIVTAVSTKRY